jgi:PAS domain S-box-containing protein
MELNKYRDQSELVKLLESIIDSSYDGLWISDHAGEVIRVNRASEKINDIKSDQVLGKKMEDLVREGLFDRSVTLEVLKARKAITMIQKLKNRKQVLATGNPVFNDQGEIILVFVKDRDIEISLS